MRQIIFAAFGQAADTARTVGFTGKRPRLNKTLAVLKSCLFNLIRNNLGSASWHCDDAQTPDSLGYRQQQEAKSECFAFWLSLMKLELHAL